MIEKEPLASEMTLRDAVAIAALQGLLANEDTRGGYFFFGEQAFLYADAFMAERAKRRQ